MPAIADLIPHHGAMCLLDHVGSWCEDAIECRAISHLDPGNPLRRGGFLPAVCGVEYALQAAAVHGALLGGAPQPPGFLAALRMDHLTGRRLDDPALGTLVARARRVGGSDAGLLYAIALEAEDGTSLLRGRATIVLTQP